MASVTDQPQRWSQATVYADMWLDPDEDPRGSGRVSPDGELATLRDYLTNYRLTLLMKCDGLVAEQLARRSVPPSTMSLLGLLRHLAEVERDWRGWILPGDPPPKLYGPRDADFDGAVAEPGVVDATSADLAREPAATDRVMAQLPDLGDTAATRICCGRASTAGLASDASSPAVPARARHVSAKRLGAKRGSHLRADRNRERCHVAPHYPTLDAIGPLSEVRTAAEPDQVLRLPSGASAARSYWEAGRAQALAAARLHHRSRSRLATPPSPTRSSGLPAAGSIRATPPSPTSTRLPRAATSPPGKCRNCSVRRSGRRSSRCANDSRHRVFDGDYPVHDHINAKVQVEMLIACRIVDSLHLQTGSNIE
jgi:hypothetical protein